MFLVIDLEGNLHVYRSPQQAEGYMETNDFGGADEEHELCDDTRQRYIADIVAPERRGGGILRFTATSERDPALPSRFVERCTHLSSHVPWVETLDDVRREIWRAKA
jgi:hypothetical protein